VVYGKNGVLEEVIPLKDGYERVKKRWVTSLEDTPYIRTPIVPYKKIIHDRLNLEIARGCTRGCRFCQAGMIYRPVRERSLDTLGELADAALESSGYGELSLSSLSTGDYSCIVPLLSTLMGRYADRKIAMSFPSLRSETLTPDLIGEIKKVRKTGFTIAPEAGTQRLRDIINKGITEDEILETVRNVFDGGWNAIKLYFMVGLPLESDEDVKGIVDLSRRVLSLTQRGRRRGQVNVSVSTFVPKAHTPFQWEPQIGLEAMGDKQEFLKKEIRKIRLTFKWQNVWMSYLEGIFSRGDRRLSGVIEKAFQLGCRFDGWSEHLNYDAWKEALRTVDGDFYTTRKRNCDEVFPWGHIESGVDRDFLWTECQRGLQAIVSPGCRIGGCANCGVCCGEKHPFNVLPQSERRCSENDTSTVMIPDNLCSDRSSGNKHDYHRVRMQFSKRGKGRFLSHLELLAVFSRALRRAKVPMRFSEGFHPLPRIVLGPALAVGIESRSEYMDLEIQGAVDCCELKNSLNREVPEWLRVLVAKEIPLKFPSISDSIINIKYVFSLKGLGEDQFLGSEDLGKRLHAFTSNDTNYLEIKRKSGSSRIDLNQWIEKVQLDDETALEVIIKMSGGKTVGPYEVLRALLELKSVEREKVFVIKTGEQFRIGPFSDASTRNLV
jgi:radical SAM-linked protein